VQIDLVAERKALRLIQVLAAYLAIVVELELLSVFGRSRHLLLVIVD
jgi:hypothetical protein